MNAYISRRSFVTSALTAAGAARVVGANDRIRIGIIGAGWRGAEHINRRLLAIPGVDVVAVCDVYRKHAQEACANVDPKPTVVQDHRRVTERNDIDAVVISTCDHWHTPILLDALTAGKDAYLEKPMTFRIEEGPQIVRAVRERKRVVQIGAQQKSGPHFIEAKERFFDSGLMGKVSLVRTSWIANRGFMRRPPAGFVYDSNELDWERFQGRGRRRPFDAQRYFGWLSYADYSVGQPGALMAHTADVAHMCLGLTQPSAVVALGGIYEFPDDRDTPDTISILAEYPEKVVLTFDCTQSSLPREGDVEFHGSGGVLKLFRPGYSFQPAEKGAPPVVAKGQNNDLPHMQNFLDCVRSRKQPRSDVVYSHYLAAVCHMGNMACQERRRINWNRAWNVEELS